MLYVPTYVLNNGCNFSSWLELGEQERADDLFGRSYIPYVREPFKVIMINISQFGK